MHQILDDIQVSKFHLRNLFVYLNTQILKIFQITNHDANQSQSELETIENHKSHLAKISVNVKGLISFLERGDDYVLMKHMATNFGTKLKPTPLDQ